MLTWDVHFLLLSSDLFFSLAVRKTEVSNLCRHGKIGATWLYRCSPLGFARVAFEKDSTVDHKYSRQKERLTLTLLQCFVPKAFTVLLAEPQLVLSARAYTQ